MPVEAPRLYPTFRCRDADAAIRFLCDVLGFREHAVYRADGVVQHAELAYGSAMVMLGQHREDEYAKLVGDPQGRRTDAIYIAIPDADALHAKIAAAGCRIEMPLRDTPYGSREFAFRDPEGNLWSCGTYWPTVGDKLLP
ncbi:MAG TPA: VOC family protein [Falsiroseomonas sp.]|jgi:uncharacterized glyoxalase superfamily protein PhnB|nr:VOC family protein [Falsiroseomonas sp.]